MPQGIYLARISDLASPRLAKKHLDPEVTEFASLMPQKRAASYVAGRVLLKLACADLGLVSASARLPRIGNEKLGRPFFSDPSQILADFSISHSQDCIAVAVGDGALRQGLDLELVRSDRKLSKALLQKVLSPAEIRIFERLAATSDPASREFFFRQWTLRECLMKFTGEGIFAGLRSDIDPLSCRIFMHEDSALSALAPPGSEIFVFSCMTDVRLYGNSAALSFVTFSDAERRTLRIFDKDSCRFADLDVKGLKFSMHCAA